MNKTIVQRIDARIQHLARMRGEVPSDASLCKEAGLKKDAIRDIRRKETIVPRIDTLAALAGPLHTTPEWLAFGRGVEDPSAAREAPASVPLVSWVAASGFADVPPVSELDDWPQIQVADLPEGRFIALTVNGDSMNRIAVDHSIIIVRITDRALVDRAFYIFQGHNGATFKRYRDQGGSPRLEPYSTNPEHDTIYPTDDVAPIGRVFRVITDLYQPTRKRHSPAPKDLPAT